MKFELHFSDHVPKVALFASRLPHCLEDLLQRQQAGEFKAEIALVLSNHPDLNPIAARYGVRFLHFPITAENKRQQEAAEMRELESRGVELIVLARYMQVLTDHRRLSQSHINIHHSFYLPRGRKPTAGFSPRRKADRSHRCYVTMNLDEGPIIEQCPRLHRDSIDDMIRKGRDLERTVLGRAVRPPVHRVLTYGNKTVVFDEQGSGTGGAVHTGRARLQPCRQHAQVTRALALVVGCLVLSTILWDAWKAAS